MGHSGKSPLERPVSHGSHAKHGPDPCAGAGRQGGFQGSGSANISLKSCLLAGRPPSLAPRAPAHKRPSFGFVPSMTRRETFPRFREPWEHRLTCYVVYLPNLACYLADAAAPHTACCKVWDHTRTLSLSLSLSVFISETAHFGSKDITTATHVGEFPETASSVVLHCLFPSMTSVYETGRKTDGVGHGLGDKNEEMVKERMGRRRKEEKKNAHLPQCGVYLSRGRR